MKTTRPFSKGRELISRDTEGMSLSDREDTLEMFVDPAARTEYAAEPQRVSLVTVEMYDLFEALNRDRVITVLGTFDMYEEEHNGNSCYYLVLRNAELV